MDPPSMLYSQLKAVEPFFLLADPNVIESEEHIMKMANHTNTITSRYDIVADITHSLQQPAGKKLDGGGVTSGWLRELIPCIAKTAVVVGVDGISW
ncbi:hypothetical protein HN51_063148, partial [Arachis hypogaea]